MADYDETIVDAQLDGLSMELHDLTLRVEALERRLAHPTMPHVVLKPNELLVLTGPEDMDPAQYAELRASVAAMDLDRRVVVISPALRAAIESHHPSDHAAERAEANDGG